MRVSVRKIKYQKEDMTECQFKFASECVLSYMRDKLDLPRIYYGNNRSPKLECRVYKTDKQISAVVEFDDCPF